MKTAGGCHQKVLKKAPVLMYETNSLSQILSVSSSSSLSLRRPVACLLRFLQPLSSFPETPSYWGSPSSAPLSRHPNSSFSFACSERSLVPQTHALPLANRARAVCTPHRSVVSFLCPPRRLSPYRSFLYSQESLSHPPPVSPVSRASPSSLSFSSALKNSSSFSLSGASSSCRAFPLVFSSVSSLSRALGSLGRAFLSSLEHGRSFPFLASLKTAGSEESGRRLLPALLCACREYRPSINWVKTRFSARMHQYRKRSLKKKNHSKVILRFKLTRFGWQRLRSGRNGEKENLNHRQLRKSQGYAFVSRDDLWKFRFQLPSYILRLRDSPVDRNPNIRKVRGLLPSYFG